MFGSRHGKGPCDACVGVVKSGIKNAVLRREVTVQSGKDALSFCNRKLHKGEVNGNGQCNHSRRTFFLIENIDHKKRNNVVTIKGTTSLHSAASCNGSTGSVLTRNLSCFCNVCTGGGSGICLSASHMDDWSENKYHKIELKKTKRKQADEKKGVTKDEQAGTRRVG